VSSGIAVIDLAAGAVRRQAEGCDNGAALPGPGDPVALTAAGGAAWLREGVLRALGADGRLAELDRGTITDLRSDGDAVVWTNAAWSAARASDTLPAWTWPSGRRGARTPRWPCSCTAIRTRLPVARRPPVVADAGWRAIAPDLPGFGDSEPFEGEAGTWDDHVMALDDFVAAHDLAPVALIVHDWGGLIGLRWACERPYAVRALVISGTGFFADGRWHGLAEGLRRPTRASRCSPA
jgi:hypothetical protein